MIGRKNAGDRVASEPAKKQDFIDSILYNKKYELQLRAAHIRLPVDQYMMLTILVSLFTGIMTAMAGILIAVRFRFHSILSFGNKPETLLICFIQCVFSYI